MSLVPGTRLGPYEITGQLGAGGMGEVYRATDTNLKRSVAIKVLPDALASDAERLARFQREAEVLARLNHPNIAVIYGLEKRDGTAALVMELVEGPTLADRIVRGPIPVEDALPIAKQIADALEAAHEQAIIHRDLKPANIKLRSDGMVKVLDFGLAKALEPAEVSPSVSQSPTITMPAITQAGVILGSAAYMAPEQAKGKRADKRCDVWAFGCVLYEMLTGHQVFGGEAVAEIIGAVIHKEPDWTALTADTPPAIRTLLRRCLQKDRQQRIPDIGIARIEIQDAISAAPSGPFLPASPARRNRERLAWSVAAVSSAIVVVLAAILGIREQPRDTRVYRASLPPVQEAPMIGLPPRRFALSPDGRHLVFTAGGPSTPVALWLRSLERGTVRRLAGTEDGVAPFWSPDSRRVAFIAQGRLKRIDIEGGPPVTLADASDATAGGSWSKDDVIAFSAALCGALFQIPATSDGAVTPATTLDPNAGDNCHWWPYFLPDGKHSLYQAVGSVSSKSDPRAVYIGSLDAGEKSRLLLNGGSNAKYAQGHVLFMRESTLMAQPFDVSRLELTGEPVQIAENVDIGGITGQSGAFSVSETGALVYQTRVADPGSQLAWFDRAGKQIGVVGDQALYGDLELSPNATHAAVSLPRGIRTPRDIWIVDLLRGFRSPFTPDERFETAAIWSSDGTRIAFNGGHAGPRGSMNLYVKSSNGAGSEQVLVEDSMNKSPLSWSHNGQFLLFASRVTDSDSNLWVVPLSRNQKPTAYMQTTFNENGARFSPDDRWVAFGSNETGRPEIWVAPFPETGAKWPVSTAGAEIVSARWRSDGHELFYVTPDSTLMAAEIDGRQAEIKIGGVTSLFKLPTAPAQGTVYDVAAEGQRFLVNVGARRVGDSGASGPLSVVINWPAALTNK